MRYENNQPKAIETVVIAVPHDEEVKLKEVKQELYQQLVEPLLYRYGYQVSEKRLIVNGTGVWHRGGPASDTGVTGRKIIVDSYGGYARVGGGAFSGKDATKVDRSGAYAARFLAKNIVAKGLAEYAEVALAYSIGKAQPIMKNVETFGTNTVEPKLIHDFVDNLLDTSVHGIIKAFDLQKPIFRPTAAYGHFGREDFAWEKIK